MREIPLSNGGVAVVDDVDFESMSRFVWRCRDGAHTRYAVRSIKRGGKVYSIAMHRSIMGADSSAQVDHIDGNGLNNRRGNLRLCTRSENQRNSTTARRGRMSPFKGVCWSKSAKKWVAYIAADGRQRHLGCFASPVAAAHAYDDAARSTFGAFARTNFSEVSP